MPLDRLLLETDAPYLIPPEPYRCPDVNQSERNEPANLRGILRGVAELRNDHEDRIAQAVQRNAKQLLADLMDRP